MDWLSLPDVEARVNALESLMVEKGLAEHEELYEVSRIPLSAAEAAAPS